MGRRDHLVRIALSANQSQIQETIDDLEVGDEDLAANLKSFKIQRFDMAQGDVLSAIGFMSDEARKKESESGEKDLLTMASACQLVNYFLPLPLYCQRNQILVYLCLYSMTDSKTFRTYDPSYLSLLRGSWRTAGWSLLWIGHPSFLVYQLGYSASMHYLQPRIVHNLAKYHPCASGKCIHGLSLRVGVSLAYGPLDMLANLSVNLGTWFILYPFWRHSMLQTLLWIPPSEMFPPLSAFYPRHDLKTFFLSYGYQFGMWLVQMSVYKSFKNQIYPVPEKSVVDHEGTYPSALTWAVSDTLPMLLGLGVEIILLRSLARDFGPSGLVLNTLELGNVGLMVKALAAEWAVEWAWLEVQYWANELWYKYKGYQE
jgi:hypothetical protein